MHTVDADPDAVDLFGVLPAGRDVAVEVDERVPTRVRDQEVAVERVDPVDAPRVVLGPRVPGLAHELRSGEERRREDHDLRATRREELRCLVELREEVAVEADLTGLVPRAVDLAIEEIPRAGEEHDDVRLGRIDLRDPAFVPVVADARLLVELEAHVDRAVPEHAATEGATVDRHELVGILRGDDVEPFAE